MGKHKGTKRASRQLSQACEFTDLESRLLMSSNPATWRLAVDPPVRSLISTKPASHSPAVGSNPLSSVPALNSNLGATAKIYLDFLGQSALTWGTYHVTTTPAYDQDGDPTTFSDGELASIREIWQRVSEHYSSFNINVTTVDPGNLNDGETTKVVFGGGGAWTGGQYGGIAYIGGFYNSASNIAWVFTQNLGNGNAKYSGEAATHEAGHTFGLLHQSAYNGTSKTADYNPGNAQVAPIMGVSYDSARGLWYNGPCSSGYNVIQDDMAVLSNSSNGFGYRADDHGNTIGGADSLVINGSTVSGSGIIEQTSDVDVFSFSAQAGPVSLTVSPAQYAGMLHAKLTLEDNTGAVVATADTASMSQTISTTLTSGTYYLVVGSHGSYGDVGQYTLSGTIVTDPNYVAPPTSLTTTRGPSGIVLTWTDNAVNESGFNIERSSNGGSSWTSLASVAANATTYTDATASVGATCTYRLYAVGTHQNSGYSNLATIAVTPATPARLLATAGSATQIGLSWGNVAGETGYKIERSANGSTWTALGTTSADVTSYSDTGLTSNTFYFYRVKATGTAGDSSAGGMAGTYTAPSSPTLSGTVLSASQIKLTWAAVSGAKGYKLTRTGWSGALALGTVTSYTDTGLSGGATYSYQLRTYNDGGDSAASSAVAKTTCLAAPAGLTATAPSATQINLSWTDSTGETGYKIERQNGSSWVSAGTAAADATSASITGLTAGTKYTFRLRATSDSGDSDPGDPASATTIPPAPATPSLTVLSATQIKLTWSGITSATGYEIDRSATSSGLTQIATTLKGVTTYTDTGLTPGGTYYYCVKAINDSGTSAASSTANKTTRLAAPAGLCATPASATQIDLSWTDSTGETSYRVERQSGSSGWSSIATPAADATSLSVTGLAAGTTYSFRLKAINTGGESDPSPTASALTTPVAPASITPTVFSNTQIKVAWPNVAGETSFRIERSTDGSTFSALATVGADILTYTDTSVAPGGTYYYSVKAANGSGVSSPTVSTAKTLLLNAPGTLAAAAASATQINLSWPDLTGETGYKVEQSTTGVTWTSAGSTTAGVTTLAVTGLTAGTKYCFRVKATNAAGDSAASPIAAATTIPSSTTLAGEAASSHQINLSWTNVAGETGYRIERAVNGGGWSALATVWENVINYADLGLSAGTTYAYRITPFNAAGSAGVSNVVTVST